MSYIIKQSSTEAPLLFFMTSSTDHVSPVTGITPTVTLSKAGGTFAAPSGAVTEIANGWYKVAANATDTNTLGPVILHATGTGADPFDGIIANIVAFDPQDAVALGLSRIDAAVSSRMATFTLPTNFSALAITVGGAVTAGTVSDKTGYALTQAFPTNFSALAITAGGAITVGTNNDKTGYALASPPGIRKNVLLNAFAFLMTDSTTHAPKTTLTVTATRSIDGAAFAACANAVTELANGMYLINLAATDLNGTVITFRFTATGADDKFITVHTDP